MTTINDQQLLKRFEPVYFCAGESFFPMGVEKYVSECSLWRIEPGKDPQIIFPEGQLTLDCLQDGVIPSQTGSVNYLQFISPLNIRDLAVSSVGSQKKSLMKYSMPAEAGWRGSGIFPA